MLLGDDDDEDDAEEVAVSVPTSLLLPFLFASILWICTFRW